MHHLIVASLGLCMLPGACAPAGVDDELLPHDARDGGALDVGARDAAADDAAAPSRATPADAEPAEPIVPAVPVGPAANERFITLTGHINGGGFGPTMMPLQICIHQRDDLGCIETTPSGVFEMQVPANAQVAITIEGEGLTPTLRAFLTTDQPLEIGNTRVADTVGLSSVAEALGFDSDRHKGAIFFGGIERVTAALEPSSGEVFFLDVAGRLLTDTQSLVLRGMGGFLNVEPGLTRVRFAHPDNPCVFQPDNSFSGWPDEEDEGVAIIPVLAGYHTSLTSMFCGYN